MNNDPYPSIPSALLNAGDIHAYAVHADTELFTPFDAAKLKPASYEIAFEGEVHYWEYLIAENRMSDRRVFLLNASSTFTIRPNSIVYIRPTILFKIPSFLAIRFNLSIKRVHQGLLLGTGPLVDPGFVGRLLIPLHNLTNREIAIRGSDGFIWVEVTKLSPAGASRPHAFAIPDFPEKKKNLAAEDYFHKANRGLPILSSVQEALDRGQAMLKKVERLSFWGALGFGLSLVVGCASLMAAAFQLYQVVQSAHSKFDGTTADITKIRDIELKALTSEIAAIREDLKQLQRNKTEKKDTAAKR